jgi:hypothetical protein
MSEHYVCRNCGTPFEADEPHENCRTCSVWLPRYDVVTTFAPDPRDTELTRLRSELAEYREVGAAGEALAGECQRLRSELEAAQRAIDVERPRRIVAESQLRQIVEGVGLPFDVARGGTAEVVLSRLEATRAMVPSARQCDALHECIDGFAEQFPYAPHLEHTQVARAWLARVEGGVSRG